MMEVLVNNEEIQFLFDWFKITKDMVDFDKYKATTEQIKIYHELEDKCRIK